MAVDLLEEVESAPAPAPAPSRVAPGRRPGLDLFLVSFLILFTELACIRWFGSTVIFLTFFTNIILLASFLGMSVGLMTAGRRSDLLRTTLPLLALAVALSVGVNVAYHRVGQLRFDVGGQGSPQQVYFGTEIAQKDPSQFVVPIEVVAGAFFLLVAGAFVGLGQAMGRAFGAIPNRVAAYTIDVLGSLAGIAAFGLASYLRLPPYLWFALGTAGCLALIRRADAMQVCATWVLLAVVATSAAREGESGQITWSPYYKVDYRPAGGVLLTNNIGHQEMRAIDDDAPAYSLPHLLARDAGAGAFDDVMIIGAGSGNDVQAALAYGAKHVDAVEIEPVLNEIGRRDHPNHPYDDPRVAIHLDDGRSFVRKSTGS